MCLFLWPPDEAGQVAARYGYDLVHRLAIPDLLMPAKKLPVLTQTFAQKKPLRLPGNSTAPDLRELIRQLDLKRTGGLLGVPVRTPDDQAVVQVVMLSPFSGRRWTSEDQERLQALTSPLAHILQRNRQFTAIQEELDQAQKSLVSMQEQIVKAESDRDNLKDLVSILQQKPGADGGAPPDGDLQSVSPVLGDSDGQDFDPATSNDEDKRHE
jgi:GAF domain-containing protein